VPFSYIGWIAGKPAIFFFSGAFHAGSPIRFAFEPLSSAFPHEKSSFSRRFAVPVIPGRRAA
jgi:hypothetical protein